MEYFKPIIVFAALFLLTSLLCWVSIGLLMLSPLPSVCLFLLGILAVVLTVDVIESKF